MREHTDWPEKRSLQQIAYQLLAAIKTDASKRSYCLFRKVGIWQIHPMECRKQILADAANYYQGLAGIYSVGAKYEDIIEDMQYCTKLLMAKRLAERVQDGEPSGPKD